jgi:hypothetical protein
VNHEIFGSLKSGVVQSDRTSPDEIIQRLDAIADTFVGRAPSEAIALETKRRIVEWKFKLLIEQNVSIEIAENLRGQLQELGFTNVEVEATIDIYFAQFLMRNSQREMARSCLERLLKRLAAAKSAGDPFAGNELIDDAERLLLRLGK